MNIGHVPTTTSYSIIFVVDFSCLPTQCDSSAYFRELVSHRPTTSPAFWISLLFRSIQMCASIGHKYKISIRFSLFVKLDLLRIYIMLQPIGLALEIEYHVYPTKTTPLSSWKKAYQWEIFSRHRKSRLLSWRSRASPLQLPCWSRHCGQNGLDLLLELEQFKVCSIRSYYILRIHSRQFKHITHRSQHSHHTVHTFPGNTHHQ